MAYYSQICTSYTHSQYQDDIDDELSVKAQLRNRLEQAKLSNMPGGFPFRYTFDGHGSAQLSYDSYEFKEEFYVPSYGRSRSQSVTVSFTSPNHYTRTKCSHLTWRVYLPPMDKCPHTRNQPVKVAVAHVQVDPAVMMTPYGKSIQKDSRVILRALAISLEMAVLITIKVADASIASLLRDQNSQWINGSIVYIGTNNSGRKDILFTVSPR